MKEIDRRITLMRAGLADHWMPKTKRWFAWYPVVTGPLGNGPRVWLRYVLRDRCMGVTNYLIIPKSKETALLTVREE